MVVIPTHMWASATKLFYLSLYLFEVVIPTHMWASATLKWGTQDKNEEVVIPTHMWASATTDSILERIQIQLSYPLTCGLLQPTVFTSGFALTGCHTHSHVGFCNILHLKVRD